MNITYKQDNNVPEDSLITLLQEVNHPDLAYETKLIAALKSGKLITAWDKDNNDKLAALISVVDDGFINAYVRFMIVGPEYRGKGINDELLRQVMISYSDFPHVYAICEDAFHAGFFTKVGFNILEDAKVLTK